MKAVVVGGGIGGLAAAIALQRAGVGTVVLEQSPSLREHGFGLVLAANAVAALHRLELVDAVRERGTQVELAEVRNPRDTLLVRIPYAELGWETYGILRSGLLDVLQAALPAGTVRLGRRCVGVDGARAVVGDGDVHGDVLIGADGLRSVVRRTLHGDEPLRYGGHRAWRASVEFEHPRIAAAFTEVWGVRGGFGFGPAGAGRVYWYCFESVPQDAPAPEDPKAEFRARYGDWFDPIPALIEATPAEAIEPTFTYDRKPLRRWGRGPATLLGDAAHPMKPNLGQGAAQALEDAVVLGLCAAEGGRPETVLRAYERRRAQRTNSVVRASRQAGAAAEVGSPVGAAVRDALFRALPNRLSITQQRRLMRFSV
jgi:2-polyprenyl-6-methoxyphenol hydroxylase-like FAD-dependent oxidoreductase